MTAPIAADPQCASGRSSRFEVTAPNITAVQIDMKAVAISTSTRVVPLLRLFIHNTAELLVESTALVRPEFTRRYALE